MITAETMLGADALARTWSARRALGPSVLRNLLVSLNLLTLAAAVYDERAAPQPAVEATPVLFVADRPRARPREPRVRASA
jgi:hypothetical protein